jgi:ribonuclease HI
MTLPYVIAATDGACSGNPGPGGWGVILKHESHEREINGGDCQTTSNRMELMAAIMALEALNRSCNVLLLCDSRYVVDGGAPHRLASLRTGKRPGRKSPAANADLWKRLAAAADPHQVTWKWVRGHAGHVMNERADCLARAGLEPFRHRHRASSIQPVQRPPGAAPFLTPPTLIEPSHVPCHRAC